MEVSSRLTLVPGVSCAAEAARVREALTSGKLNALLNDFGVTGLSVSLLKMSSCPAAHDPPAAARRARSSPQSKDLILALSMSARNTLT